MPGGGPRSDYIPLSSEAPGQLYLEDEDGPFNSRKPSVCAPQTPHLLIHVDLTLNHSRKPSILLGMHRRNMLFRPLNGSVHRGLIPNPSHTKILPSCGPPKANQYLSEP